MQPSKNKEKMEDIVMLIPAANAPVVIGSGSMVFCAALVGSVPIHSGASREGSGVMRRLVGVAVHVAVGAVDQGPCLGGPGFGRRGHRLRLIVHPTAALSCRSSQ